MSIQTTTPCIDEPHEHNNPADSYPDSVAYAMFIAGYNARIADESADIEFPDRETFDSHLYEKFQRVYTDS